VRARPASDEKTKERTVPSFSKGFEAGRSSGWSVSEGVEAVSVTTDELALIRFRQK
jgi:hypothetical protein